MTSWLHNLRVNQGLSKEENLRKLYSQSSTFLPLIGDRSSNPLDINSHYVSREFLRNEETTQLDQLNLKGNKVIVFGDAGAGKTMLADYMSLSWANRKIFSEFKYLFKVHLRNLTDSNWKTGYLPKDLQEDVLSCFLHYCLEDSNLLVKLDQVKRIAREHKETTLLLLDGYDEVAHLDPSSDRDFSIIRKALFESYPNVMMTLRPGALDTLLQNTFNMQLQLADFDDRAIRQYVQMRFGNSGATFAQDLWRFLESNPQIKEICRKPIQAELVCQLWSEEETRSKLNMHTSIGSLYSYIVLWMGKRCLANFYKKDVLGVTEYEVLSHPVMAFLKDAGYLASHLGTTVLDSRLLSEPLRNHGRSITDTLPSSQTRFSAMDVVQKFGFLRPTGSGSGLSHVNHEFIHTTFQECMGAHFLKECLLSQNETRMQKAMAFMSNPPNEDRYPMVMKFLAGLLAHEPGEEGAFAIKLFWDSVRFDSEHVFKVEGRKQASFTLELLSQMMHDGALDTRVSEEVTVHIDDVLTKDIFSWDKELRESRYSSVRIIDCLSNELNLQNDKIRIVQAIKILSALQMNPIKRKAVAESILIMTEHPDIEIAEIALYALFPFGSLSNVKEALFNKAQDPKPRIAFVAMEVLGKIGDKDSTAKLLEQLNSSDTFRVISAMNALSLRKEQPLAVIKALENKLGDQGPDRRLIAEKAVQVLGVLSDSKEKLIVRIIDELNKTELSPKHFDFLINALANIGWDKDEASEAMANKFIASCKGRCHLTIEQQCKLVSLYGHRMFYDSQPNFDLAIQLFLMRVTYKHTTEELTLILKGISDLVAVFPESQMLKALQYLTTADFPRNLKPLQAIIRELAYRIPGDLIADALEWLLSERVVNDLFGIRALTALRILRLKIPEQNKNYPWLEKLDKNFDRAMLEVDFFEDFDHDWPLDSDTLPPLPPVVEKPVQVFDDMASLGEWIQDLKSANPIVREAALAQMEKSGASDEQILNDLEAIAEKDLSSIAKVLKEAFSTRTNLIAELESRKRSFSGVEEVRGDLSVQICEFLENESLQSNAITVLAKSIVDNEVDIRLVKVPSGSTVKYKITINDKRYELHQKASELLQRIQKLTEAIESEYSLQGKRLPLHSLALDVPSLVSKDQLLAASDWNLCIIESQNLLILQKKTVFGDLFIERIDVGNKKSTCYVKAPSEVDSKFRAELFGSSGSAEVTVLTVPAVTEDAKKILSEALLGASALQELMPAIRSAYDDATSLSINRRDLLTQETVMSKKELSTFRQNVQMVQELHSKVQDLEESQQNLFNQILARVNSSLVVVGQAPDSFVPDSPYQKRLYNVLRAQLTAVYTAAQAVQTDIIDCDKTGKIGNAGKALHMIGGSIPIVGAGVQFLSTLLSYVDNRRQGARIGIYARLAANSTEMAALADRVAKEVATSSLDINKLRNPKGLVQQCMRMIGGAASEVQGSDFGKAVTKFFIGLSSEVISLGEKEGEEHALMIANLLIGKIYTGEGLEDYDSSGNADTLIDFFRADYVLPKASARYDSPIPKRGLEYRRTGDSPESKKNVIPKCPDQEEVAKVAARNLNHGFGEYKNDVGSSRVVTPERSDSLESPKVIGGLFVKPGDVKKQVVGNSPPKPGVFPARNSSGDLKI